MMDYLLPVVIVVSAGACFLVTFIAQHRLNQMTDAHWHAVRKLQRCKVALDEAHLGWLAEHYPQLDDDRRKDRGRCTAWYKLPEEEE